LPKKSNQHLKKSHLVLELHKWVLSLQGLEKFTNTLEVKPEFKDQYSVTDLRTIQDWVVKRQLSGIKGVVEINTWGGYLKQYEIAITLLN
jgi:Cu/Ag efflux pump CusA